VGEYSSPGRVQGSAFGVLKRGAGCSVLGVGD
jgi:hypothetical protein